MILDFATTTICNGPRALGPLGAVATTDPRLADARRPLPHTHPVSDIVGLDAALAAADVDAPIPTFPFPPDFFDRLVTMNGLTVTTAHGEPIWA